MIKIKYFRNNQQFQPQRRIDTYIEWLKLTFIWYRLFLFIHHNNIFQKKVFALMNECIVLPKWQLTMWSTRGYPKLSQWILYVKEKFNKTEQKLFCGLDLDTARGVLLTVVVFETMGFDKQWSLFVSVFCVFALWHLHKSGFFLTIIFFLGFFLLIFQVLPVSSLPRSCIECA